MDIKRIEEFEKSILDTSINKEVKYTIDKEIEASVKYDFLKESYGQEKVDLVIKDAGITFSDLSDPELYSKIKKILADS